MDYGKWIKSLLYRGTVRRAFTIKAPVSSKLAGWHNIEMIMIPWRALRCQREAHSFEWGATASETGRRGILKQGCVRTHWCQFTAAAAASHLQVPLKTPPPAGSGRDIFTNCCISREGTSAFPVNSLRGIPSTFVATAPQLWALHIAHSCNQATCLERGTLLWRVIASYRLLCVDWSEQWYYSNWEQKWSFYPVVGIHTDKEDNEFFFSFFFSKRVLF